MRVLLLSLVGGWRTAMFQLSGFYCMTQLCLRQVVGVAGAEPELGAEKQHRVVPGAHGASFLQAA